MNKKMKKIAFFIISSVVLFPFNTNAAWNEMVKTERLLKQLNDTTGKLVEVANSNSELSKQILELTKSNKKSSESMESLTTQITFLTWVIAGFTLIQIVIEIYNRKYKTNRRNKIVEPVGAVDKGHIGSTKIKV